MKIDKQLELNFIRAIQKNHYERTLLEEKAIYIRNNEIERQFKFTPKVNEKLMRLNEKLQIEEKRLFHKYRQIENNCKLMVDRREIDDYNIDVRLAYWNNDHYRAYEPDVDGNSFFETSDDFMTFQDSPDVYNSEPHNEHRPNAPFPEINHCYSFHSLYDHSTELTWFDIYNIDEVWMEIKVDYQFFIELNDKPL